MSDEYGIQLGNIKENIAPWPNNPARIIFIDFNFVLNVKGIRNYDDEKEFDLDSIEALNELLEKSKGLLVISSTWRIGRSLIDLAKMLADAGLKGTKVVGKTPYIEDAERGVEINLWLENVPFVVEAFVIIDDDHTIKMHKDQLILVDDEIGFCQELINDCLKKLKLF